MLVVSACRNLCSFFRHHHGPDRRPGCRIGLDGHRDHRGHHPCHLDSRPALYRLVYYWDVVHLYEA